MNISYIIIFIIVLIILYLVYQNLNKKENFNLEIIDYDQSFDKLPLYVKINKKCDTNVCPNIYKKKAINEIVNNRFFTNEQYNLDYVDVLDIFSSYIRTSPHEQDLYEYDNIPVSINNNSNVCKICDIVYKFIKQINDKILYHKNNNQLYNDWAFNDVKHDYDDGFKKVQRILGLPEDLYNKSVSGTKLILLQASDIKTYNAVKYTMYEVYVVLARELSKDKMVVKFKFIQKKNCKDNIIIDTIDIIGFIHDSVTTSTYEKINNYYNFEGLNDNNMLNTHNILKELELKNKEKQQLMQEQIENLDVNDLYTHMNIDPDQYQCYKNTRTIQDDMLGTKNFY